MPTNASICDPNQAHPERFAGLFLALSYLGGVAVTKKRKQDDAQICFIPPSNAIAQQWRGMARIAKSSYDEYGENSQDLIRRRTVCSRLVHWQMSVFNQLMLVQIARRRNGIDYNQMDQLFDQDSWR